MVKSTKVFVIAVAIMAIIIVQSEPVLSWGQYGTRSCGSNAHWVMCSKSGSGCAPSCSRRNPGACNRACWGGCDCLYGFVFEKSDGTGKCIRPSQCSQSLWGYSYY